MVGFSQAEVFPGQTADLAIDAAFREACIVASGTDFEVTGRRFERNDHLRLSKPSPKPEAGSSAVLTPNCSGVDPPSAD